MGTVAVWLWSAWRRAGDGVTRPCSSSRSGGLQGQGSTSSDAVQDVRRRWTRMIATSCGRAVGHSLVSSKGSTPGSDGPTPDLADLFGEV